MTHLDLNLLVIFDALFDLRSVTKVAQRLNLTQSAVSHALRRLRDTIGDPLFLRSGNSLQPTSRADAMARDVREGLARLRSVTNPSDFDPATSRRSFTVAAGSYMSAIVIPALVARLHRVAPDVRMHVVRVTGDLLAGLDNGTIDLALGAFVRTARRLNVDILFQEQFVWVAAPGNPLAARPVTHNELLAMPHLVLSDRRAFEPVRGLLAEAPLEHRLVEAETRTVGGDQATSAPASVYDVHAAVAIVAATNMVTVLPRRLAQLEKGRHGLKILDTAVVGKGIDQCVVTHSRANADPGTAWLKSQVMEVVR